MFSINIKGKENPKSLGQVKLELVFFKTGYPRVTKIINISGPLKEWDAKKQQFSGRGVEITERNKRLLEFKAKYLKVAEEWESESRDWSPVQWSHCFDIEEKVKAKNKVLSISSVLSEVIQQKKVKERIKNGQIITSQGTARRYETFERSLISFVQDKYNRKLNSYYFGDITEQFVQDFTLYRQKRGIEMGNAGNVSSMLRCLYGICYYASKMNVPDIDFSAFEGTQHLMKSKDLKPKTLSRAVMSKIENIDRTLLSRTENFYLDLYLFSYYTGGIASVDIAYLTWDCVDEEGYLCYERIKFPKKARIKLNAKAKSIIEKYKDKCFQNYMLPLISHKLNTEIQRHRKLKRTQERVSLVLEKIRKLIKHKDKITWYSARGTFISEMIASDIHPIDVAAMAGNSPNTIYKHYYKNVDQKQVDSKMERALGC